MVSYFKKFFTLQNIFLILIVLSAIFYALYSSRTFDMSPYESLDVTVEIEGTISQEPDVRLGKTMLTVRIENIKAKDGSDLEFLVGTNVLIHRPHYPKYQFGDSVKVNGKIKSPSNFENERGLEFDYVGFLRKSNIFTTMYFGGVERVEKDRNFSMRRALFKLKSSFIDHINKVFPEPHAGLVNGLLLGAKQSLGPDLLDSFRKTGLIHIVVLSGFNLTIIARFIEAMLFFCRLRVRLIISSVLIVMFAMLVGGGATVVRSTIMALISLLALGTYQEYNVRRSLWIAGAVMIFQNPFILLDDPSFQLSFLATLGLIHLGTPISHALRFISAKFGIREILTATIAAQIFVTPLLVFMTGEISTISLFANVLVLPLIPWIMLGGFISMLVSYISLPIAIWMGYLGFLITSYIFFIVNLLADVPFAVVGF